MGLLLHLFVVTTLVAVLHSAPLDEQAESTTVGKQPLPAVLSQSEIPKDTNRQTLDSQRTYRDTSSDSQSGNTAAQPSGTTPSTESKKIRRSVEDDKARPPPPPPPPAHGEDPAHRPPPPPPSAQAHPGYPNYKPPPPPSSSNAGRPQRDTNHPTAKPSAIPATLEKRPEQNNGQGHRPARDTPKQTKPAPLPGKPQTNNGQDNRSQRDVNNAGKGVQHKPSPIPANVDRRPVQQSHSTSDNSAPRRVRDVSSPLAAASSTTTASLSENTPVSSTTEPSKYY